MGFEEHKILIKKKITKIELGVRSLRTLSYLRLFAIFVLAYERNFELLRAFVYFVSSSMHCDFARLLEVRFSGGMGA
jgi:hypothetical protein